MRDELGFLKPIRLDTIFSGDYPLSKRYYLHIAPKAQQREDVRLYIDYLLSDDSQAYLASKGFVALPEAILQRNWVILQQSAPEYPQGYK